MKKEKKEVSKISKREEVLPISKGSLCKSENCTNINSEDFLIEKIIEKFKSKENPSENILIALQHIECVKKLLEKDLLNIEVIE